MSNLVDEHFRKIFDSLGHDPVSTTVRHDNFFIYKPNLPNFGPDVVKTVHHDSEELNLQTFIDDQFKKIEKKFKSI